MTVQKRGLGRGLEALLVDVSTNKDNEQLTAAVALIQAMQAERANLIKEIEILQLLLDDFENLVRNFNTDKNI